MAELPYEILTQIAKLATYDTYMNLRSSCRLLSKLLPVKKTLSWKEYKQILRDRHLELELSFSEKKVAEADTIHDEEDRDDDVDNMSTGGFSDEAAGDADADDSLSFFYWNRGRREYLSNTKRLVFQDRVALDLSRWTSGFSCIKRKSQWIFTKEVYYYICGNFLLVHASEMIEKMLDLLQDTKLLKSAARRIQTLLTVGPSCQEYNIPYSLGICITSQDTSLLARLLALPSLLDICCQESPMQYALDHEFLDALLWLFVNAGARLDPNMFDGLVLITASRCGHYSLLERLLQDPRVDPAIHDSLVLQVAMRWGRFDVVRLLLEDGRVDALVCENPSFSL